MKKIIYFLFTLLLISCNTFKEKKEFSFVYEFENEEKIAFGEVSKTINVLKKRLDIFGVDYTINKYKGKKIKLEIEAYKLDTVRLNNLLLNQGKLEFWEVYKGEDFFPNDYIDDLDGATRKGGSIRKYKDEGGNVSASAKKQALIDCMSENKTAFAEEVASNILTKKDENGKIIFPSAVKALFMKINSDFNFINITEDETGTI